VRGVRIAGSRKRRLDPDTNPHVVTTFPLANVGPQGIAASPDGSMWFTQTTKGNIANIDNTGPAHPLTDGRQRVRHG
jgi:streptogramin lyase